VNYVESSLEKKIMNSVNELSPYSMVGLLSFVTSPLPCIGNHSLGKSKQISLEEKNYILIIPISTITFTSFYSII